MISQIMFKKNNLITKIIGVDKKISMIIYKSIKKLLIKSKYFKEKFINLISV